MNMSTSECSSGCESGWTMYLDQSSNSEYQFQKSGGRIVTDQDCRFKATKKVEEDNDEDEDLSMVSDASSGPPHFQQDEECFDETGYFCYGGSVSQQANKGKKKKKIPEQRRGKQKQHLCLLDDTASSPIKKHIDLPPNGASMEHTSATHFKGKSALQKHFGFFQSTASGKTASKSAGGLQGRKRE